MTEPEELITTTIRFCTDTVRQHCETQTTKDRTTTERWLADFEEKLRGHLEEIANAVEYEWETTSRENEANRIVNELKQLEERYRLVTGRELIEREPDGESMRVD